ncbi:hypothetical protein ABFS82_06G091100 [Erythranthe guttata]|nr:PREDICTED: uncharacterized protein LOC105977612 isoform X1 [Erythranthe guttata]|eukprot:XP_012858388.1 PREDICTED: uncharacterized protein LOC105977612 isoform X1 [Erythranthe guttata]
MKSNDESGEICENIKIGQPSVPSAVERMKSYFDSFSDKAVDKTSNASASDDSMGQSKAEDQIIPEVHDDCLSRVNGTEHANRKSDIEDSRINYDKQRKLSEQSSDKVPPRSLLTGSEIPFSKIINDAIDLLKVQNTSSQDPNGEYPSHDGNPGVARGDKPSDTKGELLEGLTEHLDSLSPKGAASNVVCGDIPATPLISIVKNDDMEVEIHSVDETEDSDMVEQDVKVCDICGDAGREDLLAICCRCSDGAEHTYCMREMLTEVPEGDWLCEECKSVERVRNGRQEKMGKADEKEKNNSSGEASSEYANSSDAEGRRNKGSVRTPCKRHRDDDGIEVSSVGKKPALETIVGSPKTSNPSKTAALSRETSLKNLDKGRLQSSHHSVPDTVPVNEITETAGTPSDRRGHNFRGIFSKSNSFNSLSSKPKVKLVDQVVIQRQKSSKEHGSFRLKDGGVRSIGKSMSFKSTNSSRSESKIKMFSPRSSNIQDNKNTKQRSSFDRQSSFRAEHAMVGTSTSSTPRIDKRPASRGDSSSLANQHEVKPHQTDGKLAALPRPSRLADRRTANISSSLGNSVIPEKPPIDANEGLPDGSPRPRDVSNAGERMREGSGSRFGPPSAKSSRDESHNLKAIIEAAVLKKPGVYRRHRAFGQSEDRSVASVGGEVASHQGPMSSSARKNKFSSDADLHERPTVSRNLATDPLNQITPNNMKPSSLVPLEGLSSGGQDVSHIGSSSRDMFSNVPAATPILLKSLAIPEHEYIWQGSFDICRSGKTSDLWDGIQAHVSTCASPKVIDTVYKFKSRIVLYEVPRLSTWPAQFQEHGVKEDNVALFFFAKDLESYDNIYKSLLDNMMKNDLALKGNFNGVELLIFPSNQLPDNSQRWNMLYFLWGVFRGKKESCLQQMPEPLDQFFASRDIPAPIMSLPENRCSIRPVAEDLHTSEDAAAPVLEVPASDELHRLLLSKAVNEDRGTILSFDQLDHKSNASSSPIVRSESAKQCQEMRASSQEGGISCSLPLAMQSSLQLDTPIDLTKSVARPLNEVTGERNIFDKTRNQSEVHLISDSGDLSTDRKTSLNDDQRMKNNAWLFNHKGHTSPGSTIYAGTSQVSLTNEDTRNGTRGALVDMNHAPLIENAERHFFPVESSQPVRSIFMSRGSMPWNLNEKVPDLELALGGAESELPTLPLLGSEVDRKVNAEHIREEAVPKADLSLSLAFPFPEKELSTKSGAKNEQRGSNSSMLLFGNLRDN